MNVGFVGNGTYKFDLDQADWVKAFIRVAINNDHPEKVVSGHSPLGGVDIWAEEIAVQMGVETLIFAPKDMSWDGEYGYKARNLDIARASDKLYVIVSRAYPIDYGGRRWDHCYHHQRWIQRGIPPTWHVKSGGCWTGEAARKMGKSVLWVKA